MSRKSASSRFGDWWWSITAVSVPTNIATLWFARHPSTSKRGFLKVRKTLSDDEYWFPVPGSSSEEFPLDVPFVKIWLKRSCCSSRFWSPKTAAMASLSGKLWVWTKGWAEPENRQGVLGYVLWISPGVVFFSEKRSESGRKSPEFSQKLLFWRVGFFFLVPIFFKKKKGQQPLSSFLTSGTGFPWWRLLILSILH